MKNVIAVLSLAWATLGCSAANAAIFEPPGTYVYNGSVTFARDVLILQCDMELTILVPDDSPDSHGSFPHGDSATAAAQFTGGDFGCTNNIIANTATVSASLAGGQEYITFSGWTIVPIFSFSVCTGSITAKWLDLTASSTTSEVQLSSPLSDSGPPPPCQFVGSLWQSSPVSPQLQITP